MGMVLAYLFWQLWQGWGLPELVSLAIVLFVAAPVLGVVVERVVMRPLYGAATSIRLAVTLGLLLVLVALAGAIWSPTANTLQHARARERRTPISVAGITFSWEQLITVAVAIAVAVFLRVFFRRTRTGVAMRAVVDDPEPGVAGRSTLGADLRLRLDDRRHVRRARRHPARPQRAGDEHPDAHPARDLRLRRGRGGPPAQPAHDVPRRHDPRHRQLHGDRLRARRDRATTWTPRCPWRCCSWRCCSSPRCVWPSAGWCACGPPRVASARTTLVGAACHRGAGRRARCGADRQQPLHDGQRPGAVAAGPEPRAAVGLRRAGLAVPVHVPRASAR